MIKLEKTEVSGWDAAIRGMRNPLNSWDKSDSTQLYGYDGNKDDFIIGDTDLNLMQKLVKAGSDHRKFMRFITVSVDITAPLYWWKEFDTYKVGTVANSCSTMHTIHKKEFTLNDFSHEHLISEYNTEAYFDPIYPIEMLELTVDTLNRLREAYLESGDKVYWYSIIQLLPTSYNQKRTVLLNYEVLRNMYHARKAHKLDEWRDFCKWIETLPYHELITEE